MNFPARFLAAWRSCPTFRSLLFSLSFAATCSLAQAQTQTIPLIAGLNSVQFQVTPTDTSPAAVFGPLGSSFVEAATFDNQTRKWSYYRNPTLPDAATINGTPGLSMGPVGPGRGYYVTVTAPATLSVSGVFPAGMTVAVYPGANFVGFPVPADAGSIIPLVDLLQGPTFRLDPALSRTSTGFVSYTNNDVTDDGFTTLDRNRAIWVYSDSAQTWSLNLRPPPLVYFEDWNAIVVETPITGFGGTSFVRNVPFKLNRPYAGAIEFQFTGTASPNTDFSIPSVSSTDRFGSIDVAGVEPTYQIPVTILAKTRLQANATLLLSLARPVETPAVADSATLPQTARLILTDGMKGVYEGFLSGISNGNLNGQNFRVALRSTGQAIFDPGDGGLIPIRFALPYSLGAGGVPQFSGSATLQLVSEAALGRVVTLTLVPASTAVAPGSSTTAAAYEVTLNLTFANLTAAGSYAVSAKLKLTQASPVL